MNVCTDDKISASRLDARRQAILDAAQELFLDRGFKRTSLAEVVKRSGGSLATLYAAFGNKQGLLQAVMRRESERQLGTLAGIVAAEESGCAALRLLARRLYDFLVSPRAVAMIRIIMSETLSDPEFGQQFYCRGRSEMVAGLADILRGWAAQGRAAIDDPDEASAMFLAAVLSDTQMNALLDTARTPEPHDVHPRLDWRVDRFCAAFGIR